MTSIVDAGTISNRRVLNDTKDYGYPDGATVDAQGFIWSARWEGSCVLRIDPKGRIDRVVPMPARRVTNVCFGGREARHALCDDLAAASAGGGTPAASPLQGGIVLLRPRRDGFRKTRFRRLSGRVNRHTK